MPVTIRRREFITLLSGATAAWPLVARAQTSGKLRTIGFLVSGGPASHGAWFAALAERLREHRNLDYALDDVREALAAIFVKASGIDGRGHASECPAVQAPAMSPGPCTCGGKRYSRPSEGG